MINGRRSKESEERSFSDPRWRTAFSYAIISYLIKLNAKCLSEHRKWWWADFNNGSQKWFYVLSTIVEFDNLGFGSPVGLYNECLLTYTVDLVRTVKLRIRISISRRWREKIRTPNARKWSSHVRGCTRQRTDPQYCREINCIST